MVVVASTADFRRPWDDRPGPSAFQACSRGDESFLNAHSIFASAVSRVLGSAKTSLIDDQGRPVRRANSAMEWRAARRRTAAAALAMRVSSRAHMSVVMRRFLWGGKMVLAAHRKM